VRHLPHLRVVPKRPWERRGRSGADRGGGPSSPTTLSAAAPPSAERRNRAVDYNLLRAAQLRYRRSFPPATRQRVPAKVALHLMGIDDEPTPDRRPRPCFDPRAPASFRMGELVRSRRVGTAQRRTFRPPPGDETPQSTRPVAAIRALGRGLSPRADRRPNRGSFDVLEELRKPLGGRRPRHSAARIPWPPLARASGAIPVDRSRNGASSGGGPRRGGSAVNGRIGLRRTPRGLRHILALFQLLFLASRDANAAPPPRRVARLMDETPDLPAGEAPAN